jgi:hypothetical protein
MHIVELQHKLNEGQGRYNDKVRVYSASARCQKDVESLSKIGLNTQDISRSLDLPISFVKRRMARIEKENAAKRRFMATGHIQESVTPGVVHILQR